jgi:hypothetical protein
MSFLGIKKNDGRYWHEDSCCHFPKKHASFHEKRGLFWACKWCQKMLLRFRIFAQEPDGSAYWGKEKEAPGRVFKLWGTESLNDMAWRSVSQVENLGSKWWRS